MSNEKKNPYQYDPFDYNHHEMDRSSSFPFFNYGSSSSIYNPPPPPQDPQNLNGFESDVDQYPSYMSFTDCLHGSMDYKSLSRAFDMSCSSSEVITPSPIDDHDNPKKKLQAAARVGDQYSLGTSTTENTSTPNSSVSSSSNEASAAAEVENEDSDVKSKKDHKQAKGSELEATPAGEDDDKSKKVSKAKKKEKRQREPRFAFLTKSEVDHLEDGYRWRKYGQKAVKNSPYPRSYYRCTTQKCIVKKRVERSFQDPSIVITTYEGQHNHQCPATLRGNLNLNTVGMLHSPLNYGSSPAARFPHEFLTQLMLPINNQLQAHHHHDPSRNSMLYPNLMSATHQHQHQQQQQQQLNVHVPHDYGLLQDLVPSFSDHKQEQ